MTEPTGLDELCALAYERYVKAMRPSPFLEAFRAELEAEWLALPKRVRVWRTCKQRMHARIDDARFWLSQKVYPHECD